ncbi:MAG: VWA domain-containing protein [Lachnospiraceae bacterium]|nr:VWA domain-containing protein [Lachnospiraceae bacterium]
MSENVVSKKKKWLPGLIAGVSAGLVLAIGVAVFVMIFVSGADSRKAKKQLDIANKYLTNLDYENAILAYEDVIAIDPKCEEAYLSIADAYEALADNTREDEGGYKKSIEYIDKGIRALKRGYSNTDSDDIKKRLEELKEKKKALKKDEIEELLADEDHDKLTLKIVSTDVTDYPLIRFYVAAYDKDGNQVVLDAPLASVGELKGGEYLERKIKRLERMEGREGLSIELVADKSGSMSGDIEHVKDIMTEFVNSLDYGVGDAVELISFSSDVTFMCTRTSDLAYLCNGIDSLYATGNTAMYDALYEAVNSAGYQSGAKCVIAFTDGADNASDYTIEDVINLANELSVPIYIIGTNYSNDNLEYIASSTGGKYWYINDLDNMGDMLDTIYTEQKDMYVLEYYCDQEDFSQFDIRDVVLTIGDETYVGTTEETFEPIGKDVEVKAASGYEVIVGNYSWREANAIALQRGGHLVTITSELEMQRVSRIAEKHSLNGVWMGGYLSQGQAYWVTGEEMNYSNWYNGAVYDAYIGSYSGSYAMLYNIGGEWKWVIQDNDLDDSIKCGYIIEYDKPEVEQLDEEERLFKKNYMRENTEPVTNGGAETEEAEARDSDEK